MRSVKLFLFSALFAVVASASAATNIRSQAATPTNAQLEQYPLQVGPLSVNEEARLNLRPVKLEKDWTGYNYYRALRGDGRWVLETIPAGTLVLADAKGNPVYKVSCGNRLVGISVPKDPSCPPPAAKSFLERHPLLQNFLDFLKSVGWILLGALLLAALFLLLGLLFNLLREELGRWSRSPGTTSEVPSESHPTAQPASPALGPTVVPIPASPSAPAPATPPDADQEAAGTTPDAPASSTSTPPTSTRRHLAFYRGMDGDTHKVKLVGHNQVAVTHEGDDITIRFK
jgi:hypothetical protein